MSKPRQPCLVKLPPMRTSEDVVNRIQHDEGVDKNLVIVGYLDRFLGVIEKKFTSFVWCRVEMASHFDLAIPRHRIEYFKYHGEVVWSKKDRLDKVFGSSKSNETILEVVERHASAVEEEQRLAQCEDATGQVEGAGPKSRNSGPLRPTHFICIPFNNSAIKKSVKSIQKNICSNASLNGMNGSELESEGCISLSALHITLVMLYCPTPQSIADAKKVFESCLDLLNIYLPRHLLLTLQGVDSFDERVVYSPPVEIGRITKLVSEMKSRFKAFGVRLVGNHDPYSPHLTLVKLNRNLSKTLNFDGSLGRLPRFLFGTKQGETLGQQACESIQFCELYSPKDPQTGFYRCVGSLLNTPRSRPNFITDFSTSQELFERVLTHRSRKVEAPFVGFPSDLGGKCVVVIMRGLPGQGKSYFSKKLLSAWCEKLKESFPEQSETFDAYGFYISADDFMASATNSQFDPSLLPTCHLKCQERCREVLLSAQNSFIESANSIPTLIVIDNTNTVQEEYLPYQSLAAEYGAKVVVIELDMSYSETLANQSVVSFIPALSCSKVLNYSLSHGVHDVPSSTLLRMWSRWIPDPSALLMRRCSLDSIQKDFSFNWRNVITSTHASQFSFQYVGVILDEESRQRLLQCYPPSHSCIRAHHVTLCHANEGDNGSRLIESTLSPGEVCDIKVFGEIKDPNCQGLVIEISPLGTSSDPLPGHITVSHDHSVTPKYTKTLVEGSGNSSQTIEYKLREDCDPLTLRGVVSVCISKDKQLDFCSFPVDFWNNFQNTLLNNSNSHSAMKPLSSESRNDLLLKPSRFHFDNVSREAAKIYLFDLDDTLFQTPNPADYKTKFGNVWKKPQAPEGKKQRHVGGWFCNTDSLELSFEYPVCPGFVELLDRVGELNSIIMVLTGRPEDLNARICDLLGSRSLLPHVTSVVCKPSIRENTSDYKAEFLVDLCRQCPQIKRIEIWDDKSENLSAMEESFVEGGFQNLELVSHLVSPFEESISTVPLVTTDDALTQWAERNNAVLSEKQLQSRQQTIETIRNSWTDIYTQLKARSSLSCTDTCPLLEGQVVGEVKKEAMIETSDQLIHLFGSYIFERTSDVDLVVIVPRDVIGTLTLNCQWMKLLESKLIKTGQLSGFQVSSYCGTSGTVPKMSLKFRYQDLPMTEVDVIGLVTDSLEMLNPQVPLADAVGWMIEELQMKYQSPASCRLSQSDYNVLYGLSVRNSCMATIRSASITPRQFGSLIGAARRLMDRSFAMGTIRCGMRPYLIATTLAKAISQYSRRSSELPLPLSLSQIFLTWMSLHSSDSSLSRDAFEITLESLKSLYQNGTVADSHLSRILHTFQQVNSFLIQQSFSSQSLIQCLDTLSLPHQGDFRTVSIQMSYHGSNVPSEGECYAAGNVMYGILSKYFGRMFRDGHDAISFPTTYLSKSQRNPLSVQAEGSVEIASFGLSRMSVEAFEFCFSSICKDFEMAHRHRRLKLEIWDR